MKKLDISLELAQHIRKDGTLHVIRLFVAKATLPTCNSFECDSLPSLQNFSNLFIGHP